jgi:hypothetical protein
MLPKRLHSQFVKLANYYVFKLGAPEIHYIEGALVKKYCRSKRG